ncbi:MAG: anti-sigma factor family protein [Actinomycetota bacterium]
MSTPEALTCKELVELITDYLDGALSERDRFRLEDHFAVCDGCAAHLEQMRTTIELTGRLTEGEIPADGKQELLGVFRAWKEQR